MNKYLEIARNTKLTNAQQAKAAKKGESHWRQIRSALITIGLLNPLTSGGASRPQKAKRAKRTKATSRKKAA